MSVRGGGGRLRHNDTSGRAAGGGSPGGGAGGRVDTSRGSRPRDRYGLPGLRDGDARGALRWLDAACRGSGLNYFPTKVTRRWASKLGVYVEREIPNETDMHEQRRRCCGCAHTAECLADALLNVQAEDVGMWGSTTTAERKRLRKKRDEEGYEIGFRCPRCGGMYAWRAPGERKRECGHCGHLW